MSKITIKVENGKVHIHYPKEWGEKCIHIGKQVAKLLKEKHGVKMGEVKIVEYEEEPAPQTKISHHNLG